METKTHSAHPNPSVAKRDVRSARKGIFRKEGEYWTVGYALMSFVSRTRRGSATSPICCVIRVPNFMCSIW